MRVLLVGNYLPDRQYLKMSLEEVLARALLGQGVDVTLIHPSFGVGSFWTDAAKHK